MRLPYFLSKTTLTGHLPINLPADLSFAGKTILVTGGSSGIGLEAARHFAVRGAEKVIITGRDIEKTKKAAESIRKSNSQATIEAWHLDMDSYADVKHCAEKATSLPRLDIAIMNAGMASVTWRTSPEGWERVLQVNVLSTTLLAILLLPKLEKTHQDDPSAVPHLVFTGSDSCSYAPIHELHDKNVLDYLNTQSVFEERSDRVDQYKFSKLFVLWISRYLAKVAPREGPADSEPSVIVNYAHPGFNKSALLREGPPAIFHVLVFLFARPPQKGAKVLVDAAAKGYESHGGYLDSTKILPLEPCLLTSEALDLEERTRKEIFKVLADVAPEAQRYHA